MSIFSFFENNIYKVFFATLARYKLRYDAMRHKMRAIYQRVYDYYLLSTFLSVSKLNGFATQVVVSPVLYQMRGMQKELEKVSTELNI